VDFNDHNKNLDRCRRCYGE